MRLVHLFLMTATVAVLAAPPSQPALHLDRLGLIDAITAVYGDTLHDSFSVDPDLLDTSKQVLVHLVAPRDPKQLRAFMRTYLEGLGVTVQQRGDALHFVSSSKLDKTAGRQSMLYRLRSRSMAYFADLLPTVFPKIQFSFHRGIDAPTDTQQPTETQKGASPPPAPVDTGTNAYSQIDRQADVFVAQGDKEDLRKLADLLAQLDIPEPQAVVHAYLYEVNTGKTDNSGFGLTLSLFKDRLGLALGSQTSAGDAVVLHAGGAQAIVSALQADSNFKLLSSPSLRVRDGGKGRFSVGSDVPVLGSIQLDRNGNPVQSVEYKPSGVILDISPHVYVDSVSLHLGQQESSFISTSTGVNNSPTLLKREIQTDLVLKPGDVVVMGSLNEKRTTKANRGQTFLPNWMQARSDDEQMSDLLLVLAVDVLR